MTAVDPPPVGIVAWDADGSRASWPTEYLVFHITDDLPAPPDAPSWWSTWLEVQRLPGILLVVDAFTREQANRLVAAIGPGGLALRLDHPNDLSRVALHDVEATPDVLLSLLSGASRPEVGERVPKAVDIAGGDLDDDELLASLGLELMPEVDRIVRYGVTMGYDDQQVRIDDAAFVHDDEGWWLRSSPATTSEELELIVPEQIVLEPVGPDEIVERLRALLDTSGIA